MTAELSLALSLPLTVGTFSSVYLASWENKMSKSKFAIKHLVPTSSSIRVENEIYCLEKMG